MVDRKRKKRSPKPQLAVSTGPCARQIETDTASNTAVQAVDSKDAPTVPAARPAKPPSRVLRRTQSDAAPSVLSPLDDNCTWSLTSLDSGSESDLPDASSLLRTPIVPKRIGGKRTAQSRPEPKGGNKKKKLRHAHLLVKSASEIAHTTADGDPDSDAELSTIKVPGELVMACYLRKYYPARIMSQPARDRYSIEFFDGKRATLRRERFYTQYQPQFSTCTVGAMQLIGDNPAKQAGMAAEQDIDPERDFERDIKLYPRLIADVEKIRHYLDALHSCEADQIAEMAAIEDRMAVFFGDDSNAKRQLSYRVSPAFLTRAEFDLLGRLLWRWYAAPPSAILQKPKGRDCISTESDLVSSKPKCADTDSDAFGNRGTDRTELEGSESSHPAESPRSSATPDLSAGAAADMTALASSALAINFVHDVLLPHAIKRMIAERDDCSLAVAEASMRAGDPENDWVEQIMAARGNTQKNPLTSN